MSTVEFIPAALTPPPQGEVVIRATEDEAAVLRALLGQRIVGLEEVAPSTSGLFDQLCALKLRRRFAAQAGVHGVRIYEVR